VSEKEKEKQEIRVLVGGKLVTLEDLKKEYVEIAIAGTPGDMRLLEALAAADKPLTRHDIAKKAQLSSVYAIDILKRLMKNNLVLEFRMGRGRYLYYLLTEKGIHFYKKMKSGAK